MLAEGRHPDAGDADILTHYSLVVSASWKPPLIDRISLQPSSMSAARASSFGGSDGAA
jgi:hypothetical protein